MIGLFQSVHDLVWAVVPDSGTVEVPLIPLLGFLLVAAYIIWEIASLRR